MGFLGLVQPEVMAAAQLERSKDVAAQTAAIAQLVALRPTSYGVVNALRACMQDAATYCRWERHDRHGTTHVLIPTDEVFDTVSASHVYTCPSDRRCRTVETVEGQDVT